MKVRDIRCEVRAEAVRAAATVVWEERDREPLEIYFETDRAFSGDMGAGAEAFLCALALPALHQGERRIHFDEPLCPRLAEGMAESMALIRAWYGPPLEPIPIETSRPFAPRRPREPRRAAAFCTGGVDGTHMLLANRRDFPREHPDSFADLVAIIGLFDPDHARSRGPGSYFTRTRSRLQALASACDATLVPLTTNLLEIDRDLEFLKKTWSGAAITAAAHLFPPRWSSVSIASSRQTTQSVREGTHFLLDSRYSSSAVTIRHEGIRYTRLERIEEISARDPELATLIVCPNLPPPPFDNCGVCEKCVRTMTALEAMGRLESTRTFPLRVVTPALIHGAIVSASEEGFWNELVNPLRSRGRDDLAAAVERKLCEARRETGFKGRVRRFDRENLGGVLTRSIRRARRRHAPVP
jgi:hypothetical protein